MKNILCLILLGLFSNSAFSQTFRLYTDDMSGDEFLIEDKQEITYNGDSKSEGVIWSLTTRKKEGVWTASGLSLKVYGLSCLENTEVIIMFEDGTKITTTQWNKFNCDEDVWTTQSKSELEMLKTLPIKKIRVTNGRSFKSYDFPSVSPSMSVHYNKLLKSLDDGNANGFAKYVKD
jgi:hypothetical protein